MSEIQFAFDSLERDDLRHAGFSDSEIADLAQFLNPFCRTAQIYLTRLFERAGYKGRNCSEILVVCRRLWVEDWCKGTAGRIGDPDDVTPPDVGMRNTCALFDAYRQLGLKFPKALY